LLLKLPASGRHYRFCGCRAQPCRKTPRTRRASLPATPAPLR